MIKCCLVTFVLLIVNTAVHAQVFSAGDEVLLQSENPRGVPLHRLPRSSLLGFADQGALGTVENVGSEGRWLQISMDQAKVWVLARNVAHRGEGSGSNNAPATDRDALLDAACEETGTRQRLEHPLFVICFDTDWRIPVWVAYQLRPNSMSGPGDRDKSRWLQDERINELLQAFDRDYVGSGWHRGHMAPAEAFTRTQPAVDFTHQFSNAVPQSGSVNSGAWSKLEKQVRRFVENGATVWVFTGSLSLELGQECLTPPFDSTCRCLSAAGGRVDPARTMTERIAIPSHTFKTFLIEDENQWEGFAFVMTNIHRAMGSFQNYQYSIDRVEDLLDIDLYSALDAITEESVESNTVPISTKRRSDPCL